MSTLCGYTISDIRKSLREAIDHRDRRTAFRWTAELVATPGAVGSLWATYWLAWAAAQGGPTVPILLKQSWAAITTKAHEHSDWIAFRNDEKVRWSTAETTTRLLDQPSQSPVIWPAREIILYDVGTMRSSVPSATDGPLVLEVWRRDEDPMEIRLMAGHFLTFLESGDLRRALSAVAWSLMTNAQQGLPAPLKYGSRGPPSLPPKARTSPIWFWLDLGRVFLQKASHRGWPTMHSAISEAFYVHYTRWTASERMRILLAWILQLRASMVPQPESLWIADPVPLKLMDIDISYKEIAAEIADPNSVVNQTSQKEKEGEKKKKESTPLSRSEAKLAESDAAVLAMMGITDD